MGEDTSEKPTNITAIDEIQPKCDSIGGSIANGTRKPVLSLFSLDKLPRQKIVRKEELGKGKKTTSLFRTNQKIT